MEPASQLDAPDRGTSATWSRRLLDAAWPEDRGGRIFTVGVALSMVVGLAIRVAFVLVKQSRLTLTTGDAYWYHMQAKLVAEGKGFLNPFLYFKHGVVGEGGDHPHGFTLILTVLDLLGIDSAQGQRLVMCLVGTVSVLLIALLARRLAGDAAGVLAAVLAAVYPNLWINDGMLMVETVYIAAIAVSLLATYRYLERASLPSLVVLSVSLTLGAMTRPEAAALFVFMVTPLVLTRRSIDWRRRIAHLGLAAVFPILAFAPWIAYNLVRFEEPVVISTGAGQTLAAGNCDVTYSGWALGYYDLRCLEEPEIVVPTGDPSQRDPQYRELALDYMSEHRGELPRVIAARVGRLWHLYAPRQSLVFDGWIEGRAGGPPSGDRSLVGAALIMYFAMLPFAIGGAAVLLRRKVALWPLLVQPILATVIAAQTFGVTRYRAGAEISLVVLAAIGAVALWNWVRRRAAGPALDPAADHVAPPEPVPGTAEVEPDRPTAEPSTTK